MAASPRGTRPTAATPKGGTSSPIAEGDDGINAEGKEADGGDAEGNEADSGDAEGGNVLPNSHVLAATSAANAGISSKHCTRSSHKGFPPNVGRRSHKRTLWAFMQSMQGQRIYSPPMCSSLLGLARLPTGTIC